MISGASEEELDVANQIADLLLEIEWLNNIIDELEKTLKYDIKKSEQYMDRFICEEHGNYPVHYYRAEWQKEKAIGYLDKLNKLKGDNK